MNYPTEVTLHNLQEAAKLDIGDIPDLVHARRNMVHIGDPSNPVATFGKQGVQIGGTRPLFQLPKTTKKTPLRDHTLSQVLKSLDTKDISLNHVGFGYQVEDIDTEVARIVHGMKGSVHNIYEDPQGRDEDMRRLFVGDADEDGPMCEIVLPEKSIGMRPHVQFDIDTQLSMEEIQQRISGYFGDDFFDWHLPDIPGVGRVLSMGTFENRWIDLRVGIGSKDRNRNIHRRSMGKLHPIV